MLWNLGLSEAAFGQCLQRNNSYVEVQAVTAPVSGLLLKQDRVEASPSQMAHCSAVAEAFSKRTGVVTRVIGWYHSHPHITVLPSHVDLRTQSMYQMLDQGFVGIIASPFNEVPRAGQK
jgi:proteasome lid subunit RPN8/RPN11